MIIEVYARRRFSPQAAALVELLRADGKYARQQDPRHFEENQIDSQVVFVYHDGTDPLVPWAYGKRGIPCELIPSIAGETTHAASDEHHLQKVDGGFALIAPDGTQVGDAQPTEADAWWLVEHPGGGEVTNEPFEGVNHERHVYQVSEGEIAVGEFRPMVAGGVMTLGSQPAEAAPLSEDEELAQLQRELDALDTPPSDEKAQE